MTTNDDALAQRVQQVDANGKERFGDDWHTYLRALHTNPKEVSEAVARAAMATEDPAAAIAEAGKLSLINAATNFDHDAERAYSKIRDRERQEYRISRGRG